MNYFCIEFSVYVPSLFYASQSIFSKRNFARLNDEGNTEKKWIYKLEKLIPPILLGLNIFESTSADISTFIYLSKRKQNIAVFFSIPFFDMSKHLRKTIARTNSILYTYE